MYPKKLIILFIVFLSLSSLFGQSITKGPYLAAPEKNSITIRWESDTKLSFTVKYGPAKSLSLKKQGELLGTRENHYLYEANISQLTPGENYFYQVTANAIKSGVQSFKCNLPQGEPVTFIVTGDSRSRPQVFGRISEQVNQLDPDLIISVGDLVREGGSYAQWGEYYFDAIGKSIEHIPLVAAIGDHEADDIDGDAGVLFTYFLHPHMDHKKLWFSYDYGDAHFVALDYRYPDSKEMIEWFKKDMDHSKARWNFVYTHRPSYNVGGHRSAWGRTIWPELFSEYKIDIVFAGHSHLYERFYPVRPQNDPKAWPVTYITSGGSGASLYDTGQSPFLAFTQSIHHYMVIDINRNHLDLKTYKIDGSLLDKISWEKNSKELESLVKPQDELDVYCMFTNAICKDLERLPMEVLPADIKLDLKPVFCKEDIQFDISLTEESAKHYQMETIKGVIKGEEPLAVTLKIYAKGEMIVSEWGDIVPELRLQANYKADSFAGYILGEVLEYKIWD